MLFFLLFFSLFVFIIIFKIQKVVFFKFEKWENCCDIMVFAIKNRSLNRFPTGPPGRSGTSSYRTSTPSFGRPTLRDPREFRGVCNGGIRTKNKGSVRSEYGREGGGARDQSLCASDPSHGQAPKGCLRLSHVIFRPFSLHFFPSLAKHRGWGRVLRTVKHRKRGAYAREG